MLLSEWIRILLPCITFFVGTYMGWRIYQAGYDDGRRATGQTVTERKPLIRMPKPEKPIDNNPYYDDILANIEAYDGTEAGQRAVRNKK